ncbi:MULTISPECIES: conjugal transfer protein [Pseudomonas syringae group]|uniref:conjugal transfer protein n=1 Tax=Pseudomonas syringae group TaxID=136849 RepID=UPI000F06B6A4|nr:MULTISPECIES: conjugal transfer protein [Pseudomonas syringae group]TES72597.1 conjugal transfer protein [Pseudomonas syringae pv. tomato]
MFKKSMCPALLVLCCLPVISFAAVCRSGDAAQAGSAAGYEQSRKADEAWAERERTVSDQLQNCLSRIRTTSVSLPSFPSLQDVLDQVTERVCQAAVDKINSQIPSSIDPWQQYQNL